MVGRDRIRHALVHVILLIHSVRGDRSILWCIRTVYEALRYIEQSALRTRSRWLGERSEGPSDTGCNDFVHPRGEMLVIGPNPVQRFLGIGIIIVTVTVVIDDSVQPLVMSRRV